MKQKAVTAANFCWTTKDPGDFSLPPFTRIGNDWLLIAAGNTGTDKGGWNTMTASWGGLGVLWGKNVAFVFIRPQRYTRGFTDASPCFSLSFFDNTYREALNFCGAKSGRDFDKAAETGLTPIEFPDGTIGFEEAREIISCRKLYTHDFESALFLDQSIIAECYPNKDFHRMYIGEVTTLRVKG